MSIILIFLLFIIFGALGYSSYKSFYIPFKINKLASIINTDQVEHAIRSLQKLLKMDPNNILARWYVAIGYQNMSQYILAIKEFNTLLKIGRYNKEVRQIEIRKNLAHLYNKTNNYPKMIAEYINISRLDPGDFETNFNLGFYYYKNNNYSLAMDCIKKALIVQPQNPEVNYILGELYYQKNDFANAEEKFSITLASISGHAKARFRLGIILYHRKEYQKAAEQIEALLSNSELKNEVHYWLGKIYYDIGDHAVAIGHFEKAVKMIRDNSDKPALEIRYFLAQMYKHNNRLSDAMKQWKLIHRAASSYLDVDENINHYQKLLSDKHLKLFSEADDTAFRTICQKIINSLEDTIEHIEKVNEDKYIIVTNKTYNNSRITNLYYFYRGVAPVVKVDLIELNDKILQNEFSSGYFISSSPFDKKALQYKEAYNIITLIDPEALSERMKMIYENPAEVG